MIKGGGGAGGGGAKKGILAKMQLPHRGYISPVIILHAELHDTSPAKLEKWCACGLLFFGDKGALCFESGIYILQLKFSLSNHLKNIDDCFGGNDWNKFFDLLL